VLDRREPLDVIDLEEDRERHQPPDARNPEQALDCGRLEKRRPDGDLQDVDLVGEQPDKRRLGGGLDLVEGRQVRDPRDIPFFEQPIEAILGTAPPGDHLEPRAEDVAWSPERGTKSGRCCGRPDA